jgi:hypothetical protein
MRLLLVRGGASGGALAVPLGDGGFCHRTGLRGDVALAGGLVLGDTDRDAIARETASGPVALPDQ